MMFAEYLLCESVSVPSLSTQLIAIWRNTKCTIYIDFSSPNCILVSLLLLQMPRTRTGWSGSVFAVVLHVGWHQVAEAEHGCVRVLIHSTPGQAEDAFSSSTATGGCHGIFLAVSSVICKGQSCQLALGLFFGAAFSAPVKWGTEPLLPGRKELQ